MRRISVYIISIFLITCTFVVQAQDTIVFPLKIKAGLDVSGPVIYFTDKSRLNTEGYLSVDLNPGTSVVLAAGYLKYNYSQYNFDYRTSGIFFRAGPDFNLRKPEVSSDKYWAGIGLRYGLSIFTSETPKFLQTNYWGTSESSIPATTSVAHFLEVSPGLKSEVFKNFSIGWSVSLRMLLHTGTGRDIRPLYLPGFGNGGKTFSTGLNYYFIWSFPYKSVRHIVRPEPIPDATPVPSDNNDGQPPAIRP